MVFVATANRVQPIPPPLLDRMELIELPGYTQEEKLKIAMRHLIPRVLDQHGLSSEFLKIPEVYYYFENFDVLPIITSRVLGLMLFLPSFDIGYGKEYNSEVHKGSWCS